MQQQQQQQQQRWRGNDDTSASSSTSSPPHHRTSQTATAGLGDRDPHGALSNAHRQIIGNYELGRVLATGDFDCRTRLCSHVTTGVPYVVRIYDKHVLAEAQWMWDRVAESIHVQRKLPRDQHVLEMVECFESNTSVYILMHLFPSMNLTKAFTDATAQAELLTRLHIMSRAALRASMASSDNGSAPDLPHAREKEEHRHSSPRASATPLTNNNNNNSSSSNAAAAAHLRNRPSFRQIMESSGHSGTGAAGPPSESSDIEHGSRGQPASSGEGKKTASGALFPEEVGDASVATTAAVQSLSGPIPPHIPLPLIRVLFEQAVKGVVFLHQHHVAHTGIAPDHLLVSPEGLLRIGNMVSACFCAPGERLHELRGTMHTVAPEVLRGEAYDPFLADAWALGVVFYFMLNRGRYPHDGANTLRHILHGHTRPSRAGLPTIALDLLSRLLQPKPEDRLPVDAVLAHPFFTAPLPSVEEEMLAEAVEEQSRGGGGRRSLYTGYNSTGRTMSDNATRPFPGKGASAGSYNEGSVNSTTGRGGASANARWGSPGNAPEDADANAGTGSWSSPQMPPPHNRHASFFSAGSESNSVVMPVDLSTTYDNLDNTTTALSSVADTAVAGSAAVDSNDRSAQLSPRRHPSFPDGRPQRTPTLPRPIGVSHSAGNSDSTGTTTAAAADFRSRIAAPGCPSGAKGVPNAKRRPLWRPEQAGSIEELEDLAARVIQHHFRTVSQRRRYKAETHALMKRGQSMYLGGSSSRDAHSSTTSDGTRGRAQLLLPPLSSSSHTARRSSSLTIHVPVQNSAAAAAETAATAVSPSNAQHDALHRRLSSIAKSPVAGAASPSSWRRRGSYRPPPSSQTHTAGPAITTTPLAHGRWPSTVGFNATATAAAAAATAAAAANTVVSSTSPSSHGRYGSNSIVIDTRATSLLDDHFDSEDDGDETGNTSPQLSGDFVRPSHGKAEKGLDRGGAAAAAAAGVKAPRTGSMTLPSLAATARGNTDWAGESASAAQRGTSRHRVPSVTANPTLFSQQGRRRSTISAVLSTVPAGRSSLERQRSAVGTVSDGEVCPLCHREPYAIRSIAVRPYAATPYQFSGGAFQRLLE